MWQAVTHYNNPQSLFQYAHPCLCVTYILLYIFLVLGGAGVRNFPTEGDSPDLSKWLNFLAIVSCRFSDRFIIAIAYGCLAASFIFYIPIGGIKVVLQGKQLALTFFLSIAEECF